MNWYLVVQAPEREAMIKILMRAGLSPLDNLAAGQVIAKDLINENAGNMLFPYSIMRILMCEDTQIHTIDVNCLYSAGQIAKWNEEYDYFVIPLANAFRRSFRIQLGFLTSLVKQLKIPCILVGAGVQAGLNGLSGARECDKDVKDFLNAILDKSAIAGIRGEYTAQYLKGLGFTEERDFTVIGCPSMYLHGPELPQKPIKELTPKTKVSFNCKIKVPRKLGRFVFRSAKRFEQYTFIPQGIDDLRMLYAGESIDKEKFPKIFKPYPCEPDSKICASGHELGFTDARSWLEYLSGVDFSFGTRIHGNIAAVIAGTPAFIFASDGRILELARYHNIPHMPVGDLSEETDIFKVYEQADFAEVRRGHAERFAHYAGFLEKNGLSHIYMEGGTYGKSLFDEKMAELPMHGALQPLYTLSEELQAERLRSYQALLSEHKNGKLQKSERLKSLAMKLPGSLRNTLIRIYRH